jgi:hypothetical protein
MLISLMKADIDLENVDVKAVLLDTGVYTYNAAHNMYDDLTGVVATETGALGSKTLGVVAAGTFDAADGTVTAATGNSAEACATFVDRGGAATADDLLSFNELSSPVTPNGGNIVLQWSESGIFQI